MGNDEIFPDKLNVNLCQIAFNNGILDLQTLTFRVGILPSDYLNMTLDYNYEENSYQNNQEKLHTILLKIYNRNEEHLDYMLSVLNYESSALQKNKKPYGLM